jgi:hypothetical protein
MVMACAVYSKCHCGIADSVEGMSGAPDIYPSHYSVAIPGCCEWIFYDIIAQPDTG